MKAQPEKVTYSQRKLSGGRAHLGKEKWLWSSQISLQECLQVPQRLCQEQNNFNNEKGSRDLTAEGYNAGGRRLCFNTTPYPSSCPAPSIFFCCQRKDKKRILELRCKTEAIVVIPSETAGLGSGLGSRQDLTIESKEPRACSFVFIHALPVGFALITKHPFTLTSKKKNGVGCE